MASYKKSEAREWAREKMLGVANVTIPTMTADFAPAGARYFAATAVAAAVRRAVSSMESMTASGRPSFASNSSINP